MARKKKVVVEKPLKMITKKEVMDAYIAKYGEDDITDRFVDCVSADMVLDLLEDYIWRHPKDSVFVKMNNYARTIKQHPLVVA